MEKDSGLLDVIMGPYNENFRINITKIKFIFIVMMVQLFSKTSVAQNQKKVKKDIQNLFKESRLGIIIQCNM